jgi:hypothetical protein
LVPEVRDLNAADVSYALEVKLPDLKEPFVDLFPSNRRDGIAVGQLGLDGGDRDAVVTFAAEIAPGDYGEVDSLLLHYEGKLLFESYYRHAASIPPLPDVATKSYMAMAIRRAIQLGHQPLADLDQPVVGFLKDLDQRQLAPGAKKITLAEAMNMRSGVLSINRLN